ncbi:3'(2'),5'-bisphosphate nucleotidase CysQ [Rhodobacter capsulatus]|uniref:Inositol monophosphatase family protein n=1 Tax=Rhodobacter capsulatus (strain ATCC BAA-309 / NBRC 16581 / SB1003) TaxID=272942 RepID=D5AKH7_RHOCB|nr:3'(2'),5'-bisphosphate nucleotidase CysQ [Rhodobacter capsulatus]ADE83819.1 inositol monophosphatase family protein [Rhodobacter capsulatus SB 1003]ETD03534.1 inositol monophosphatase [Rhodobacter capsulatus DE442]ETD80327.1 inositol monophosphatase [Rhodobacter capsulatus R121]ETD88104.1 inositol monophosphatase [Rhodobacter capsulatus YW2]ETE55594.1 inositol monophosphatase [Rhodobacter capsulatus Y262]
MPGPDAATDLDLLIRAAEAAGELALQYWKHAPKQWDKAGDAGPVSEADLAVNDLLAHLLRKARPEYGWLSEESQDDAARLSCRRLFVVDPIDGTRAFLSNEPGFAHAIAVVEDGEVLAGVVHLPVFEETYAAVRGGPALLNGQPIRNTDPGAIEGSSLLASKVCDIATHWRHERPGYRRFFRPSLAWRLCLVAESRFDASLTVRPTWEWDVAAASLIATCAGALVTDRSGAPLRFNTPSAQIEGLLVGAPGLHAQYLAQLRPQSEESGL